MSQENVELVLRVFDAFNKGEDSPTLDADIVVTPPAGWPDAGQEIRGLEAWRRQVGRLRDSWENPHLEIDEIRSAGEDRVVVLFHYVTTGKDSGIPFETAMGAVHTIRNGKIVRLDYFLSPAEALAAAGLSE
jgi:ketosteroid isomerase-like protein